MCTEYSQRLSSLVQEFAGNIWEEFYCRDFEYLGANLIRDCKNWSICLNAHLFLLEVVRFFTCQVKVQLNSEKLCFICMTAECCDQCVECFDQNLYTRFSSTYTTRTMHTLQNAINIHYNSYGTCVKMHFKMLLIDLHGSTI